MSKHKHLNSYKHLPKEDSSKKGKPRGGYSGPTYRYLIQKCKCGEEREIEIFNKQYCAEFFICDSCRIKDADAKKLKRYHEKMFGKNKDFLSALESL